MDFKYSDLRKEVIETQYSIKNFACDKNWPLALEAWKETAGRPLGERFAHIGRKRLEAIEFLHSAAEPMIGRVREWKIAPEDQKKAYDELLLLGKLPSPGQTGHCEPFYDEIFSVGLDGIKARAEDTPSFVMAADAVSAMIELAAEKAVRDDVSEMCRHIAHKAPRSFKEAIQLMWFVCLAIQAGDDAYLVGPGRIDRRLIKFYEQDIASGALSRNEALEYIELLYLFINQYAIHGLAFAVMVGGSGIYNELSYLALEALRRTRLVYPTVGLCCEEQTPPDLKKLAVELISDGISNVAIFNDDLIKRAMQRYGIPEKDSGEYINSTCVEITPCGRSAVYVASPYFSLCDILLRTLNNSKAADYAQFFNEFKAQLACDISKSVDDLNAARKTRQDGTRRPIQSLFTLDCISRKLDIEEGGAEYNWVECSFVGLANLADSLFVLKKAVFEEKDFTLDELRKKLQEDFKDDEPFRLKLLNAYPKYGNGNKEVDSIVGEITVFLTEECAKHKIFPNDTSFIPGTFCWVQHQLMGKKCGATPDGRRAGFPFADGAGPAQGREKKGPTCAVRSVCSWDHSVMLGGSAFNQRYSKAALNTPEKRKKFETLLDIFIKNGGFETQINVLDAEILKKAQANPEEYRDLVVRIGGYTDYFVGLAPEMQSELIMRTIYQDVE